MIRWGTVGLVLLVGLAACGAGPSGEPTPQEKPAPVVIKNNATQIQTFTVAIVPTDGKITEHLEGNVTHRIGIDEGSSSIVSKTPILRIELPQSSRTKGNYTLEPGERRQLSIKNISPNEAIVVLVYDESDNAYRSIKFLNCNKAVRGYRVTTQSGGPDNWTMSTHQCG